MTLATDKPSGTDGPHTGDDDFFRHVLLEYTYPQQAAAKLSGWGSMALRRRQILDRSRSGIQPEVLGRVPHLRQRVPDDG
jgi:hypothetical protein